MKSSLLRFIFGSMMLSYAAAVPMPGSAVSTFKSGSEQELWDERQPLLDALGQQLSADFTKVPWFEIFTTKDAKNLRACLAATKSWVETLRTSQPIKIGLLIKNANEIGDFLMDEGLFSDSEKVCFSLDLKARGVRNLEKIVKALKVNTAIKSVDLWSNYIGDAGAKNLAEALEKNTALKSLDLSSNSIGPAGAKNLADALKENTGLQSLDLGYNSIRDAGAMELAKALKNNTALQSLDLSGISMGPAGAKYLAEELETNTGLQSLDLSYNYIGDKGAEDFAEALKNNTARQSLVLRYKYFGDKGADYLADA
ncbi:hypothetical protein MP638_004021, partial [Amoeboaphelidium occidentale]